jgi:hypothetical protein
VALGLLSVVPCRFATTIAPSDTRHFMYEITVL